MSDCDGNPDGKLAAKLEKVRQRLTMGASNMTRPGADLIIWYLNPDRLPVADDTSGVDAKTTTTVAMDFGRITIRAGLTLRDVRAVILTHATSTMSAWPSDCDRRPAPPSGYTHATNKP